MTFGGALLALQEQQGVTRLGWNGRGQVLRLMRPTATAMMTLPYIYLRTATGDRIPWVASQTDLLAEDWELAY
jgi:hypothetical protein